MTGRQPATQQRACLSEWKGKEMAISWISALKMVPWDVVVSNAPGVVDGARKLWNGIGKKKEAVEDETTADVSLEARLEALEADVSHLQQEMASSAELIKALADQNAQLVQAVAVLRKRQQLMLGALAILAAGIGLVALLAK